MAYEVRVTSSDGREQTFSCGGATDQEALIYAGKVVEKHADRSSPDAPVKIFKDGKEIGPTATVADMLKRAV